MGLGEVIINEPTKPFSLLIVFRDNMIGYGNGSFIEDCKKDQPTPEAPCTSRSKIPARKILRVVKCNIPSILAIPKPHRRRRRSSLVPDLCPLSRHRHRPPQEIRSRLRHFHQNQPQRRSHRVPGCSSCCQLGCDQCQGKTGWFIL